MSEEFKVTYTIEDGYVGYRPHKFTIYECDLEDGMDEDDLREFFYNSMNDHFQDVYNLYSNDQERFIEWAKKKIAEREEDCE